jgi:hypothetical protein
MFLIAELYKGERDKMLESISIDFHKIEKATKVISRNRIQHFVIELFEVRN